MNAYQQWLEATLATLRALPPGGDVLDQCLTSEHLIRSGTWIEFGVAGGNSLRRIVAAKHTSRVFGLDSFKGLPEDWNLGDRVICKGGFAQESLPVIDGAELLVGLFQDTLPTFSPRERVTFAHIDCDIYSGAKCALEWLRPRLAVGALVTFDELWNYPNAAEHELKALYETFSGVSYEWLYVHGGLPQWPNERAAFRVL